MTTTITQKDPIKGSREFTLINNEVQYTIRSPLRTDSLSVVLDVLDANPVISESESTLSFVSKVNREPLVELFLNNPDKETFDQFVDVMSEKILEEDFSLFRVKAEGLYVDVVKLGESIDMLQKHVKSAEIDVLLSTLLKLKANPSDVQCQSDVAEAFNELGFTQGQVITYAPYINFLLSGNRL